MYNGAFTVNGAYLPFISIASGSTITPFVTTPTTSASPFYSQVNSAITYAVDSLSISFINT